LIKISLIALSIGYSNKFNGLCLNNLDASVSLMKTCEASLSYLVGVHKESQAGANKFNGFLLDGNAIAELVTGFILYVRKEC